MRPRLQPSKLTGAPALQGPACSSSSASCIPRLWPGLQRPLSSQHGRVISAVEGVSIRRCKALGGQLGRLCSLSLRRQPLQVLWLARRLGWMGSLCASLQVRALLLPAALALLLPWCSCLLLLLLLLDEQECSALLLGSMLLPM